MGSAPSLYALWRAHGFHITLIYWYVRRRPPQTLAALTLSFGAAFPTFYRLLGPYAHPKAPDITRTELYETIQRRGWAGNLFMGVIPMVSLRGREALSGQTFYAFVNLTALLLEGVWTIMKPLLGYRDVDRIRLKV